MTHLLIVDPQNDFCDMPQAALPVNGASNDLTRLAQQIRRSGSAISAITMTLDSHHVYDIAHPGFWVDPNGQPPAPYTAIELVDVEQGRWLPVNHQYNAFVCDYLMLTGLFIWPEHCIIGSLGHGVYPVLQEALMSWERQNHKTINVIYKGMNPLTEHFSAFEADVPLREDPYTQFDRSKIAQLVQADNVLVAGEALSHCVAHSVRSLLRHLGQDFAQKLILLTDCTSPVAGFEAQAQAFLEEIADLGARLTTSDNLAF